MSLRPSIDDIRRTAVPFLEFLNQTGSPYHCVLALRKFLDKAGFIELDEKSSWEVQPGNKYYITRNNSSLAAFVVGSSVKTNRGGFCITATHSDSPCLRIRPCATIKKENYNQLGVECYGGGLWHTWFDRGLGICGKVIAQQNGKIQERFIRVDKPIIILPNLAIHLRTADEIAAFKIDKEQHLQPILCTDTYEKLMGVSPKEKSANRVSNMPEALQNLIASELNVASEDIVEWDLCLMDANPSRLCGIHSEYIESGRLDNLFSTFAAFTSLIEVSKDTSNASNQSDILCAVTFDHEEIGSQSFTGANSSLLESWLSRLSQALDLKDHFGALVARSLLISADMAHAVHPNYSDVHQPQHKPEIHRGIVFKEETNQRYTSHATTMALLRQVANIAQVPTQNFCVKNNSRCGSTVGPMLSARLGIRTIDIGAPQLAMHSCRELCGTVDVYYMEELLKSFYRNFRSVDGCLETKL